MPKTRPSSVQVKSSALGVSFDTENHQHHSYRVSDHKQGRDGHHHHHHHKHLSMRGNKNRMSKARDPPSRFPFATLFFLW